MRGVACLAREADGADSLRSDDLTEGAGASKGQTWVDAGGHPGTRGRAEARGP
jgi:hypothetical protein